MLNILQKFLIYFIFLIKIYLITKVRAECTIRHSRMFNATRILTGSNLTLELGKQ
jgi:hypothetical protein